MITREASLIRKWFGEWKILQINESVTYGNTATATYNVPASKVFFPCYFISGSQAVTDLRITLNIDGTLLFDATYSSTALENVLDLIAMEANSYASISIKNNNALPQQADMILLGFIINRSDMDNFLKELRQYDVTDKLENLNKNVAVIINQLNLIGTQLGANMTSTTPTAPPTGETPTGGEPGGGFI